MEPESSFCSACLYNHRVTSIPSRRAGEAFSKGIKIAALKSGPALRLVIFTTSGWRIHRPGTGDVRFAKVLRVGGSTPRGSERLSRNMATGTRLPTHPTPVVIIQRTLHLRPFHFTLQSLISFSQFPLHPSRLLLGRGCNPQARTALFERIYAKLNDYSNWNALL